ncbi:hypothetical protein U9M48_033440 [Paspalum notatum var. saurae]|uniref:Uncharacterized protein n=1 Tax=Paspalum notatum var. saurae TaxID=547442 RepID=A0AAQ3X697_PASNO
MAGASLAPGEAEATPNQRKRKAAAPAEDEDEAEAEELERELADLDRRTLEHIRGTATRLVTAAASHLAALRPPAPFEVSLASGTFADDKEQVEKLKILKSKMEANVADLPMVLEKMKDSISHWERLQNLNVNIHPVFQRKT